MGGYEVGKCLTIIKKVLFVIEPELTHCYVAVDAEGDCPLGVQGWHHKTFPASMSALDILKGDFDYLMWPLDAPN
jgi:hypothetical protein